MDNSTDIKKLKLAAAAYYFKENDGVVVDASLWQRIQNALKVNISKPSYNFYATDLENEMINGESVKYGLCVFRYAEKRPTYAEEISEYWTERKLGYFIIVEYHGLVAIQIRNAVIPKLLTYVLTQLNYSSLTTLNNDSNYTRISMKNLEGGANAMRERTFVADDLSRSMSAFGANHYMLSSFNGKNSRGKTFAVTTSTARIAERGQNLSIHKYCELVKETIDNINAGNLNSPTDFLSVFAEYVDYKEEKDNGVLVPSSILLSTWVINDMLDNAQCSFTYALKGQRIPISLADVMHYLEMCTNDPILLLNNDTDYVDKKKRIHVKLWDNGIIIDSFRLKNLEITSQTEPEYNGSLARLINRYGLFNVYFDSTDLIYTQGGLYKNHNLLSNFAQLLSAFEPIVGLANIHTEKHHNGHSFEDLDEWSNDSIFKLVEDTFRNKYDYLICDDLEKEWADHIGIKENEIAFFVEKYSEGKYSASDFQEAIGQALKNIGNLSPLDTALDSKKAEWEGMHTTSRIARWSNPQPEKSIDDAIFKWKCNRSNPFSEKKMCLVVNFISLDEFKNSLNNFNNLDAKVKAVTFQRLWLLSSFVNACIEAGVTPKIYCKN